MENKNNFEGKNWGRKEFGRNAIIGILGGGIAYNSGVWLIMIIGSVLSVLGWICAFIWLYRVIRHKN